MRNLRKGLGGNIPFEGGREEKNEIRRRRSKDDHIGHIITLIHICPCTFLCRGIAPAHS